MAEVLSLEHPRHVRAELTADSTWKAEQEHSIELHSSSRRVSPPRADQQPLGARLEHRRLETPGFGRGGLRT